MSAVHKPVNSGDAAAITQLSHHFGALVDQLLELAAEARVIAGGAVVFDARVLPIIRALTSDSSATGTDALAELTFDAARWISTRDAAARMGCSSRWIRALARNGTLRAQQLDGRWLIAKASIDRYAAGKAHAPVKGRQQPPTGDDHHGASR